MSAQTHILLLRGINVGGRNKLPMKDLVALLEELGCRDVRTYIQSGNVVVRCPKKLAAGLAQRVTHEIGARHGFEPFVLQLSADELEQVVAANPFPKAESNPKSLHLGFLNETPSRPDLVKLEAIRAASERFELIDRVLYLHAPDGVARSKLAAGAERLLGVTMTARNWRTVCEIREIVTQVSMR